MKYIEVPQFGGPEVLRLVEADTPEPGEGMLLVEVQAAGINYADVLARSGLYPTIRKAPFVLGFEVAGVVREVGRCVEGFKAGDSVAAITPAGGGYATHVLMPAATAIPIPGKVDAALAAALLMQGVTAYITLDQAQVKTGDVVMITAAAGGVGRIAVQLAKARGATVIGLASKSKGDLVKGLGADHVFEYGKAGWSAEVFDVTRSQGVQVFLDSVGDLASEAFPLLSPFGQWIIYGVRTGRHNPLPAEAVWPMIGKNISLRGFNLATSMRHARGALGELFKLVMDGRVTIQITKYALADASLVHTLFEERKTTGKLIFLP